MATPSGRVASLRVGPPHDVTHPVHVFLLLSVLSEGVDVSIAFTFDLFIAASPE